MTMLFLWQKLWLSSRQIYLLFFGIFQCFDRNYSWILFLLVGLRLSNWGLKFENLESRLFLIASSYACTYIKQRLLLSLLLIQEVVVVSHLEPNYDYYSSLRIYYSRDTIFEYSCYRKWVYHMSDPVNILSLCISKVHNVDY